jgi:hypothetical protein
VASNSYSIWCLLQTRRIFIQLSAANTCRSCLDRSLGYSRVARYKVQTIIHTRSKLLYRKEFWDFPRKLDHLIIRTVYWNVHYVIRWLIGILIGVAGSCNWILGNNLKFSFSNITSTFFKFSAYIARFNNKLSSIVYL